MICFCACVHLRFSLCVCVCRIAKLYLQKNTIKFNFLTKLKAKQKIVIKKNTYIFMQIVCSLKCFDKRNIQSVYFLSISIFIISQRDLFALVN